MRTTLDENGRIQLPEILQSQLGLKPGDELSLEEQNGQWILKPLRQGQGVGWEGNILAHRGCIDGHVKTTLAEVREERLSQLSEGLPG